MHFLKSRAKRGNPTIKKAALLRGSVLDSCAMVDFNDLTDLGSPIEVPYEFEIDINTLVTINHKITLEGISREEQKNIDEYPLDDEDDWRSNRNEQESFPRILGARQIIWR